MEDIPEDEGALGEDEEIVEVIDGTCRLELERETERAGI